MELQRIQHNAKPVAIRKGFLKYTSEYIVGVCSKIK